MSETTRVEVAERAARAGAAVAADAFRTDLDVETKRGKNDLVTDADRRAQRRVVEVIERSRPDETVIGEEEGLGSTLPAEGTAWIVDPIDGTTNYVYGSPLWTTSGERPGRTSGRGRKRHARVRRRLRRRSRRLHAERRARDRERPARSRHARDRADDGVGP
jgi:hypothetical protein